MDNRDKVTDGLETCALIGWVRLFGDDPEVLTRTAAGRAALVAAEDAELDAVIEQRNFFGVGEDDK